MGEGGRASHECFRIRENGASVYFAHAMTQLSEIREFCFFFFFFNQNLFTGIIIGILCTPNGFFFFNFILFLNFT